MHWRRSAPNDAMPDPLTPLERKVYRYLIDFLAEHTYQPSVREIGQRFQIRSTKTVAALLQTIADKGYIERAPGRSRGVKLLGYSSIGNVQPIPQYASLASGISAIGKDDVVRYVAMDRSFVTADDAFLLAVPDDAMLGRGLARGDLVLVDPAARARDGDLVVARIDATHMVRTMEHRGASLALWTADAEPTQRVLGPGDDFTIVGVVATVVRALRAAPNDGETTAG
ncbi:MAG: transcriptional repressor LexA [Gemmatimonadaceae bacterium]